MWQTGGGGGGGGVGQILHKSNTFSDENVKIEREVEHKYFNASWDSTIGEKKNDLFLKEFERGIFKK